MILKSFEIENNIKSILKSNFILIYGENIGLIEDLKKKIISINDSAEVINLYQEDITKRMGIPVTLSIQEIRKPDLDAKLLAESVAQQLERRVMFRRAMKRAVQNAMRQGAEGVKIRVAGRLGGAEIARAEIQKEGRVPLHTLRADVDYGLAEANTTYGVIGVKAWVFRGEVLDTQNKDSD